MDMLNSQLQQAREAVRHKDYALAYHLYDEASEERPMSVEALLDYGRAKFDEDRDLEGATLLLEQALTLAPESVEILVLG